MTHNAERSFSRLPIILLTAFLLLLFSHAQMVSAVGGNDHAVIHLTGKHADGKYTLDTKDLYLFSLENIAPGDQWNGSVIVQNATESDMAVAVQSIVSTHKQDNTLFDALDLQINVAGANIYRGPYANPSKPVTGYYLIHAGDSLSFDLQVTLPQHVGNECQGKQMDSTWTFDAMYFQPTGNVQNPSGTPTPGQGPAGDVIQTGRFMITSNTELITCLLLFLSSGAGLIWMTVRYCRARKSERVSPTREAQKGNHNGREDASQCQRD